VSTRTVTYECKCCGHVRSFRGEAVSEEEIAHAEAARLRRAQRLDVELPAVERGEVEAFDAGWDSPTWFDDCAPLCSSCPTTLWMEFVGDLMVPTRRQHHQIHLAWAATGRHPEGGAYPLSRVPKPMSDELFERIAGEIRRRRGSEG
jgi:hypothetical protein